MVAFLLPLVAAATGEITENKRLNANQTSEAIEKASLTQGEPATLVAVSHRKQPRQPRERQNSEEKLP